jgi:cation diffusion facilitator family transporter
MPPEPAHLTNRQTTNSGTKAVVYAALIGNLLVALTKTAAGFWTGSSAMQSEAIHSFVDTGNEVLLLYGMHRAAKRADPQHPLGYGRELYFWSFIVALLVFAVGAGVSFYQGVTHLRNPEPIDDPLVNYLVLAFAFVFEGVSWAISLRQFKASKGTQGFYEAAERSKDPPSFMVFFEDSAALLGIALAAIGTFMASTGGMPVFDGLASIGIGIVLAGVAILLARESKSLLIGETADRKLADSIVRIASAEPCVAQVNGLMTVQLAPDQIVAALSVEFTDDMRVTQVEQSVMHMEEQLREAHPELITIFIKPQTPETYRNIILRRYGAPSMGE